MFPFLVKVPGRRTSPPAGIHPQLGMYLPSSAVLLASLVMVQFHLSGSAATVHSPSPEVVVVWAFWLCAWFPCSCRGCGFGVCPDVWVGVDWSGCAWPGDG